MTRRILAAVAILLSVTPAWAANGQIGLYFDVDTYTCQLTVPCHCSAHIYVYGLLQGASASGVTGAEYKVAIGANGNPDPGWLFSESFDPGATVLGPGAFNPPDGLPRGVDIAWPSCQLGDGSKVLLETVSVLNAGDFPCNTAELQLLVTKHDTPSNAFFQCPLFVLCDAPVYTKVCVGSNLTTCPNPEPPFANNATCSTSGRAWLNPAPTRLCSSLPQPPDLVDCSVAVRSQTWSRVKGLYRD